MFNALLMQFIFFPHWKIYRWKIYYMYTLPTSPNYRIVDLAKSIVKLAFVSPLFYSL